MKYKVFGNTIVARIDRGEEILASVETICRQEAVNLASISAIGAVGHAVVGLYRVKEQCYSTNTFDGELEMTSLTGNVTTMDGEVYLHLHASFADEHGQTFGGHLSEAIVSGTCELFLQAADGTVSRIHEEATGLNLLDL
jgi:Predicted DNA-binding protein with PD1-like DNA-binding motif